MAGAKARAVRLTRIVLTKRNKEVEDFGLGKSTGLVLHATGNDEAVAGNGVEGVSAAYEVDVTADHVDHLFVGMGVAGTAPAGLHVVADQHHAWVEGEHLPGQALFGVRRVLAAS